MDPEGGELSSHTDRGAPILMARGLVKRFGQVTALSGADLDLYPGEVLAVIGDNGAGKSSLIKCLSGVMIPDEGEIELEGRPVHFRRPHDAFAAGIETVYQTVPVAPPVDIASDTFLGRQRHRAGLLGTWLRMLDKARMASGGRLPTVAVARAGAVGSKVVILDEPTAALGVKEAGQVLQVIDHLRARGLPVILISHKLSHVFEVADRIHIQRLGRRVAVVTPQSHTMAEAVAIMTGAVTVDNAA